MTTTIRQLLDAWETELFPITTKDTFVNLCSMREMGLKQYMNVCWKEIKLHTETPQLSVAELSPWRKEKIEKNIKNLCLYLDELVGELDKKK